MHIANGMYGLILVEPEGGLPPVDREFYVMQSDFYTKGEYGEEGFQPFSMEKAIDEDADYVVFNGSVGAMVGDRAVRAKVGETIRLYVGNGGPNLVSSFHVIGEIFDTVYTEGGTLPNQQNVQSTLIPAGGSAIVEFKVEVPGTLILVDHSIFRAFNKGALGMINVEGPDNSLVYSGKQADRIYLPEGGAIQEVAVANEEPAIPLTHEERLQRGQRIYEQNCAACHQMEGKGISGVFPPLANSDYLMQDLPRAVRVVISGLTGEIDVNGKKYNNIMPSQRLNDHDISNVIGYITNTWGNQAELLSPAEVAEIRAALANH
jgi:nitrite reductase (NO-forming)